ncbi:hypothetical protein RTBOTA2_006028 [Rhodotorula toruloides]|nr:hypothetical protein RTBOTA2_006028 [Rhodotorula toruloides]
MIIVPTTELDQILPPPAHVAIPQPRYQVVLARAGIEGWLSVYGGGDDIRVGRPLERYVLTVNQNQNPVFLLHRPLTGLQIAKSFEIPTTAEHVVLTSNASSLVRGYLEGLASRSERKGLPAWLGDTLKAGKRPRWEWLLQYAFRNDLKEAGDACGSWVDEEIGRRSYAYAIRPSFPPGTRAAAPTRGQ